ncbi:hypothetical protein [Actinoplanes sp. NPDC026619]|uniref:hypothetical protein n=1 Tax=Actinoplanes sp. NPDC026619 TaxID=3155798 RepID=UPI0033FDA5A6
MAADRNPSELDPSAEGIRYSRRLPDPSGARVEQYDCGELVEVDYYDGTLESITAEHSRDYPGIGFAVVRKEDAPAGFRWEFSARYAADGAVRRLGAELVDPGDSVIMGLEYGPAGELLVITKFWDGLPGQDSIAFEYGPDGQNYIVAALSGGDTLKFADVLGALAEPDFYADGLALPPQLAGISIPSVRDRF